MREGLYDVLLTRRLNEQVARLSALVAHRQPVGDADRVDRLARFLAEEVRQIFADRSSGSERSEPTRVVDDNELDADAAQDAFWLGHTLGQIYGQAIECARRALGDEKCKDAPQRRRSIAPRTCGASLVPSQSDEF